MKDPDFDVAFSIGGFQIFWYAILLALGIAVAMLVTDRRARKRELPKDIALDLCILGVPFGILGARLFACVSGVIQWEQFFDLSHQGLSFFGGVVFAALAVLVYLKLRKVNLDEMLDTCAPGVFAGIGLSVWGDFFNRIHYGPLVENSAHKWFPLATFGNDLKIHYAAFFYEFLLCVLLIALYYVFLKKRIRKGTNRFLLMVFLYSVGRFCIDSIRQDLVKMGPLAFDQVCEMILFAVCLVLLFFSMRPSERTEEQTCERKPACDEAQDLVAPEEGSIPDKPEANVKFEEKDDFTGLK